MTETTTISSESQLQLDVWPVSIASAFARYGLKTWGDLVAFPIWNLVLEPGVGNKGFHTVREEISNRGFEPNLGRITKGQLGLPVTVAATCGVYFIRCGDFAKIGYAKSIRKRFTDLQLTVPFRLELLATIPCQSISEARDREREMHRQFETLWFRGEWFHFESPLTTFISDLSKS